MTIPATLLHIEGIGFPDWAVRGLTMTLTPIEAQVPPRRCVNGNLVDVSQFQFQKYRVSIRCEDHDAPQLTGVWRGKVITLTCVPGLGVVNDSEGQLTFQAMVTNWETGRKEYQGDSAWVIDAEQS